MMFAEVNFSDVNELSMCYQMCQHININMIKLHKIKTAFAVIIISCVCMVFIMPFFTFKMSVLEHYDNNNKIPLHYEQNGISSGKYRLKGNPLNGLISSTHGPEKRNEATLQNTTYTPERKNGSADITQETGSTENIVTFSFDQARDLFSQIHQTRRRHTIINCSKIVTDGDLLELSKAQQIMKERARPSFDVTFFKNISNCGHFLKQRGYITHPLSEKESNFPIAFSMIVYKDIEQVERLLRAIYRPQNMYCVHIDLKATADFIIAMNTITKCFENVFIAPELLNVTWGTFSVLEAEMICLRKLLFFKKWKYFINLTGQEFPLKTNTELVEILAALDGANVVDGTLLRPSMYDFHRWTLARTPPPHKIRPVKGSVHVAINRYMVDFAVNSAKAQNFYMWLRRTSFPDESFFSSLNYNPILGINGSFIGKLEDLPSERFIARYKVWRSARQPCGGKYERNICVLGVADLYRAYHDVGLFVNKLHLDFQYLALDCLEEVMYENTLRQFIDNTTIDTTFYKQLYFCTT